MEAPKNIKELHSIIENYAKENPSNAIYFLATDLTDFAHIVTNHPTVINQMKIQQKSIGIGLMLGVTPP